MSYSVRNADCSASHTRGNGTVMIDTGNRYRYRHRYSYRYL